MERQLTLLPAIDDKKVQKEVVSVLKEYRALKMRFNNEVEQEGIRLFPEIRNSRRISELKVKQMEKTLEHILDKEERDIITMKFLTNERVKDSDVYHDLLLKKTYFYEKKQSAVKLIATALGII
ncbi:MULTISPECIES: ArpU family phage packaging/lysis transcriptional regulator [Bacillus]|uniref:ArpU family phage packaging/lysis transcriptional regulator n=1 Tax=Bacillus TaxID=1386 RepID=UPI0010C407DE|nr:MULTISPECIES: ArpU family phage packaging/lysis transcriptional regulator [Bacillus]MBK5424483.1 ArpU family transcriptional regulator [Bacillus sp. TH30]QBP90176.1 ArpU family transcriptional regulator [Bacillus mycoides]QWH75620.1 ArpU family transcriptional regulator [Bacillus mycoides]WOA60560.1 ArpU family phage packaging/lysis transcriptional regulator [Bacillus mycoides]WOA66301.1 ArpU family phage packaging/lysis transcriptional regulator [Bacillus mycoides]